MMKLIDCRNLSGRVDVPISKSLAHRYLMYAFIEGDYDRIRSFEEKYKPVCDDVLATVECLEALIDGKSELNCRESGTTLRMLLPVAAAMGREVQFTLEKTLIGRPVKELTDELVRHGAEISISEDGSIIKEKGRISPGEYTLPGGISSQYISGMLFAFMLMDGESSLKIEGPVQSQAYISMTKYVIENYSQLGEGLLEGDWSAGAMWIAANELLGGTLEICGLENDSIQGDCVITEIIDNMKQEDAFGKRKHIISAEDHPDLVPAVILAGLGMKGMTEIDGAGRLRIKESDRLSALASILRQLGAEVSEASDSLTVCGTDGRLLAGTDNPVDCPDDHRMIMFAALASIVCEKPVRLANTEAVSKSYPEFFKTIERLNNGTEA